MESIWVPLWIHGKRVFPYPVECSCSDDLHFLIAGSGKSTLVYVMPRCLGVHR